MTASNTAPQICWPSRYWLKWLLLFFGSLIVGGLIAALMPKPPKPVPEYDYVFTAYDTNGKEVKADYVDAGGVHTELKSTIRSKGAAGKKEFYTFERTDVSPIETLPAQEIVWHTPTDHKQWLNGEFRQRLSAIDANYNRTVWNKLIKNFTDNSQSSTLDYPVVFRAKPDAGKGKAH